jgi:hypothetical protein
VIPFRMVAVPRCEGSQISLFPSPLSLHFPNIHTLPSMSSQACTRRRVQPPARFPKYEIPPVLPVSVPGIRAPTDSTPMEAPAVTCLPPNLPKDDNTPSIRPTLLDEGPSVGDLLLLPRRSCMPTLGNLIMLCMMLSTALRKQIT